MAQRYPSQAVLHVRTNGDPAQLAPAVRDALASLDVNIPLYDVKTLRSHMLFATFTQRLAASMLGGFGILALTLAGIGLYSVMAYAVSQRTREVGIRMALGAQPSDVLRLIVRQGMTLLAIGLAVGLAMAFGAMPLMAPVLIGVDGRDPVTFGAVSLLLAVVALAASYIPARRAAAVDPIVAYGAEPTRAADWGANGSNVKRPPARSSHRTLGRCRRAGGRTEPAVQPIETLSDSVVEPPEARVAARERLVALVLRR